MQSKREVVAEKAYLYSLWKDEFHVYEGYICKTSNSYNFDREPEFQIRYFFIIDEDQIVSSSQKRSYNCGEEEGEVYNKVLWLREPDERKAKDIFVKYESYQIKQLQDKINKHRKLIKLLED